MANLLSIILASIRQQNLTELFDNLEDTAHDMDSFEVLIKLDDDDSEIIDYLESEKKQRPFSIRYIATPKLDGYWSLYLAYNELLEMASEETYFVTAINDETRYATRHWDDVLRGFVGYFPDDVFHLRISERRNYQFKSLVESMPWGENFGFFTKKWLSLTEGIAIGPACVDTGQECVNFFLRTRCGYLRGVPTDSIKIANEELTVSGWHGLSKKAAHIKQQGVYNLYTGLLTRDSIENFYRLACKLNAYIWASESGLSQFELEEDTDNKKILVKSSPGSDPLNSFSYEIDFLTRVSIYFNIETVCSPKSSWETFPPVLAHRIFTRRELAQLWLNTPPDQLESAYDGDLGKARKIMLKTGVKNKKLNAIDQFYINKLVRSIAGENSELDKPDFTDNLLGRILNNPDKDIRIQDFLAARLYCLYNEMIATGLNLSPIPNWLLDDFSLTRIQKTKQIFKKIMPPPVQYAAGYMLARINKLIEKILDFIDQVFQ